MIIRMELLFIGGLGFLMGVITSISGGAGVFAVPAMLAFGVPPINTLALNRISDLGVLAGAIRNYLRVPEFQWRLACIVAVPLFIGAIIGANFSVSVSTDFLQWFILAAVFVGIIFLLWPIKPEASTAPVNHWIGIPALLIVGFWSGSVAMAGATFAVIVLVRMFRQNFLGARSIHVFAAVPETVITVLILTYHSTIDWRMAAVMFVTSLVGAYLGSKLAIKKGSNFIRYAMVAISLVMIAKVAFDLIL